MITDYRKPSMAAASDLCRAAQYVKADKLCISNLDFSLAVGLAQGQAQRLPYLDLLDK